MKKKNAFALALIIMLLASGCSVGPGTSQNTETLTPTVNSEKSMPDSEQSTVIPTVIITPTMVPVTPAQTVKPTATPTKSPTAKPTATPTPKPTAIPTNKQIETPVTQRDISLISITSVVSRNEMASVRIKGKPNTEYKIEVYYSTTVSKAAGLERKQSDGEGYVEWTWKVGPNTKAGEHKIVISGGGSKLETSFVTS